MLPVSRTSKPLAACTSAPCDALGLLVTTLQLAQFLPQHFEMASRRSAVGVSPWLLFFSSLYTYLAAIDTLILAIPAAASCATEPYRCFIAQQPLLQMLGSAFLSIGMWYWYLLYHHDDAQTMEHDERQLAGNLLYAPVSARIFFNAFSISAFFSAFITSILILFFGIAAPLVRFWAYLCGLVAALLNAVMWLPQIYVTFRYGHRGALSIGWVLASVVMDVAYSVYLAAMGVHWTVWANNVPDALQTTILLVLLAYFAIRDARRGVDRFGQPIVICDRDGFDLGDADDSVALLKGQLSP